MRRQLAALGMVLAATLLVLPGAAGAQGGYPNKTVKIIVPFPAGGINDVLARIVADKLQVKWGQSVIIENKTGAGGNIGADLAAQADPDGYTLFVAPPGPLAINHSLYKQLSYKPEAFVPITVLGSIPNVVIVRPGINVSSVKELIAYAKGKDGKANYGSQGNGATPHLNGVWFQNLDRDAARARALSRRGPGRPGHAGRTRRHVLRQYLCRNVAAPRGQAQDHRRPR